MESASGISYKHSLPRPDVVIFMAQVVLLFIVVITSLANLTLDNGNTNLWTMILTSCLGYMMPSPHMKAAKAKNIEGSTNTTPIAIVSGVNSNNSSNSNE